MDNLNNQEKKLIFPENVVQIMSDILKEYQLEETDDEISQKLENDQPFSGEIIMGIIKDLFFKKIQEKDISTLLQQKLNLTQNIAENLSNSIKTKLIPLIKLVDEIENEEGREEKIQTEEDKIAKGSEVFTKIKPPLGVSTEPLEDIKKDFIPKKIGDESLEKEITEKLRKTIIKEDIKTPIEKLKKTVKKQSDNYREPTE